MEKILLYLLLSFSVFPWTNNFNKLDLYYSENPEVKVRIVKIEDIEGKLTFISDSKIDSYEKSQSLKLEFYQPLLKVDKHKINIGYGLKFQEPVSFDSKYSRLTYLIPLYFSTLYEFNQNKYEYFGKFNIGYGFAMDNKDEVRKFDGYDTARVLGGLYFSLESGIIYENVILGLSYNQASTKMIVTKGNNQNSGKVDIDYSMISLNLGYRFKAKKWENQLYVTSKIIINSYFYDFTHN